MFFSKLIPYSLPRYTSYIIVVVLVIFNLRISFTGLIHDFSLEVCSGENAFGLNLPLFVEEMEKLEKRRGQTRKKNGKEKMKWKSTGV